MLWSSKATRPRTYGVMQQRTAEWNTAAAPSTRIESLQLSVVRKLLQYPFSICHVSKAHCRSVCKCMHARFFVDEGYWAGGRVCNDHQGVILTTKSAESEKCIAMPWQAFNGNTVIRGLAPLACNGVHQIARGRMHV